MTILKPLLLGLLLCVSAAAEEINLAWEYPGDTNYISFTLWVGINSTNFIMPVATSGH